jgi:hypothetical protein
MYKAVSVFLAPTLREMSSPSSVNMYIPASMNDEALFNALLYTSSAHIDSLRGEYNGRSTLFHLIRTIQFVNRDLRKCNTGPSDLTIATVLFLTNVEVSHIPYSDF